MSRWLLAVALLVVVSGCAAQSTVQVPIEVTREVAVEVTREVLQEVEVEVTREVVRVETEVVVVTATPIPATSTPEPTLAPTAVPEPTPIPEPTAAPPLAPGEWVEGEIIRTIRVYDIPNEHAGHTVITADPGANVRVLYRGGLWYQVEGESASSGETVTGWVYKDWIRIAPEDEARIQSPPKAMPVIVTKITQTNSQGWSKKYWTGTVMNVGSQTAYDVQVEITLNGQFGDTETRADRGIAFVATRNLEPGQSSTFSVVTDFLHRDDAIYSYDVLWSEQ